MINKEQLTNIYQCIYIKGYSIHKTSRVLNIHRDSIKKYADIMKINLDNLKNDLISQGKLYELTLDDFINMNLDKHIDKIIFTSTKRSKRVLTNDIIIDIQIISTYLNTTSPQKIYDFIQDNWDDLHHLDISYSSIRRALINVINEK